MRIFLLIFISCVYVHGQTIIFSNDFEESISGWNFADLDGDGISWGWVSFTGETNGQIISESWDSTNGPLTPDNWAISPDIDLSGLTGTVTLKWEVFAIDPDFDAENYTVYVAPASSVTFQDIINNGTTFNEPTLDGVNSYQERTLDISSRIGETVIVVFRHHDVSDQFLMAIDNVIVENTPALSTVDVNENGEPIVLFPKVVDTTFELNIDLSENNLAKIYDASGRFIKTISPKSNEFNVSNLASGNYFIIVDYKDGTVIRQRFIKR